MNKLHRIFIAINFTEKLKKDLAGFQYQWPQLPARWTKSENLHLTLLFLGNANDQEICDICSTVKNVAARHDHFDLTINRIIYGPPKKIPPRMVWAAGKNSEELGSLQKDLESSLLEFSGGSYKESSDYGFSPHITLARIEQSGLKKMEVEEIPAIDEKMEHTFLVDSIEVMESELKKGGPIYTILESANLGQ